MNLAEFLKYLDDQGWTATGNDDEWASLRRLMRPEKPFSKGEVESVFSKIGNARDLKGMADAAASLDPDVFNEETLESLKSHIDETFDAVDEIKSSVGKENPAETGRRISELQQKVDPESWERYQSSTGLKGGSTRINRDAERQASELLRKRKERATVSNAFQQDMDRKSPLSTQELRERERLYQDINSSGFSRLPAEEQVKLKERYDHLTARVDQNVVSLETLVSKATERGHEINPTAMDTRVSQRKTSAHLPDEKFYDAVGNIRYQPKGKKFRQRPHGVGEGQKILAILTDAIKDPNIDSPIQFTIDSIKAKGSGISKSSQDQFLKVLREHNGIVSTGIFKNGIVRPDVEAWVSEGVTDVLNRRKLLNPGSEDPESFLNPLTKYMGKGFSTPEDMQFLAERQGFESTDAAKVIAPGKLSSIDEQRAVDIENLINSPGTSKADKAKLHKELKHLTEKGEAGRRYRNVLLGAHNPKADLPMTDPRQSLLQREIEKIRSSSNPLGNVVLGYNQPDRLDYKEPPKKETPRLLGQSLSEAQSWEPQSTRLKRRGLGRAWSLPQYVGETPSVQAQSWEPQSTRFKGSGRAWLLPKYATGTPRPKGQPLGKGVLLPGPTGDLPSISLLQKATEMPKELQSKLRGTGGPQSILEKAKLASPLYSEFVPNTPGEMFTAHTGLAGSGYPTMTQNVQTPGSLVAEELVDPVHPEKIRGRKAVGEYMPEGNKIFTKAGIHKGFQKELAIPGVGLGGADPVGTFSASSGVPAGDTFVTQAGSPGPYGQFSSGGDDVAKFKRIKGAGGKPGGVPKMLTGGEQSRTFGSGYLTQGSTNPIPNPQSPLGQPNQGAFWLGGGKPPGGGSPHPNTGGGSPPPGGQPPPNPSGGPTSSKSSAPKYGGFSLRDQLTGPQKRTASNTLMGKVSESMRSGWLGKAGKVGGGVLGGLFAISMLKDLFGGGDESQMNADAQSQAVLANMQQAFLAAANEGGLMPTMAQQYGNLANTALEGRLAAILQNPTVPLADINPGAASALGAAGGPRQRSTNPMLSRLMSGEINLNPEEQGLRDPTKGFLSAFMGANAAMATPNPQMMGPQMMPQQQQAPQPGLSDLIAGGLRRTGLPGYVISPIDSAGAAVSDTARGIVEQDVQELQNELAGMTPGSEDYMRKVQALQRAGYSPSAIRTVMGGM